MGMSPLPHIAKSPYEAHWPKSQRIALSRTMADDKDKPNIVSIYLHMKSKRDLARIYTC
jgi:hypothetical protein